MWHPRGDRRQGCYITRSGVGDRTRTRARGAATRYQRPKRCRWHKAHVGSKTTAALDAAVDAIRVCPGARHPPQETEVSLGRIQPRDSRSISNFFRFAARHPVPSTPPRSPSSKLGRSGRLLVWRRSSRSSPPPPSSFPFARLIAERSLSSLRLSGSGSRCSKKIPASLSPPHSFAPLPPLRTPARAGRGLLGAARRNMFMLPRR
jgi:hypothetical protein